MLNESITTEPDHSAECDQFFDSTHFLQRTFNTGIVYYQLPHINCIARSPNKSCLSHDTYLCQVIMTLHFLNDVIDVVESTRKSIITP